jgi:hypothetical protein
MSEPKGCGPFENLVVALMSSGVIACICGCGIVLSDIAQLVWGHFALSGGTKGVGNLSSARLADQNGITVKSNQHENYL